MSNPKQPKLQVIEGGRDKLVEQFYKEFELMFLAEDSDESRWRIKRMSAIDNRLIPRGKDKIKLVKSDKGSSNEVT